MMLSKAVSFTNVIFCELPSIHKNSFILKLILDTETVSLMLNLISSISVHKCMYVHV